MRLRMRHAAVAGKHHPPENFLPFVTGPPASASRRDRPLHRERKSHSRPVLVLPVPGARTGTGAPA